MKYKKLTMYQIASRAALGEIPEGYYVKWIGNPPGRVFEDYADGSDVMIVGVDVPQPDGIVVKGAYEIDVESYHRWDFERDKKVKFGPVELETRFMLDDVKFLYKVERKEELENYINNHMYMDGRVARKKDYVFNVIYVSGDRRGTLMNAWIQNMKFPEDDEGMIEVKLVCDYVTRFEN